MARLWRGEGRTSEGRAETGVSRPGSSSKRHRDSRMRQPPWTASKPKTGLEAVHEIGRDSRITWSGRTRERGEGT